MKKNIFFLHTPLLIAILSFMSANPVNWKVKEDSYSIKFSSKKIKGIFTGLKSTIFFNYNNLPESKIIATINVTTANTGNGFKNKHVLKALEVGKYQTIKFESTSISKKGNSFEAIEKLTMTGVSKDIVLPFSFQKTETKGFFLENLMSYQKNTVLIKEGRAI